MLPVKSNQLAARELLADAIDPTPYHGWCRPRRAPRPLRLSPLPLPQPTAKWVSPSGSTAPTTRSTPSPSARIPDVFHRNRRSVCELTTPTFGRIAYIEVGAINVASIVQTYSPGPCERGQEKGFFQFGGSTVVLLFEPGAIAFDSDLVADSAAGLEVTRPHRGRRRQPRLTRSGGFGKFPALQPLTLWRLLMSLQMRVGLGQFNELTDEKLAFIKQMGCDDFLMNTPKLPGDKQWEYEDLAALKKRADDAELRLMALENVPSSFYDQIMLGQSGPRRTASAHDHHRAQHGQGRHPNPRLPLGPQQRLAHARASDLARRCPRHSLCPRRARS